VDLLAVLDGCTDHAGSAADADLGREAHCLVSNWALGSEGDGSGRPLGSDSPPSLEMEDLRRALAAAVARNGSRHLGQGAIARTGIFRGPCLPCCPQASPRRDPKESDGMVLVDQEPSFSGARKKKAAQRSQDRELPIPEGEEVVVF